MSEVTWDDQQAINSFGKLNNRLHELRAELNAKKKLEEDYEDASNELMISDEEEVRYVLGECFAHLSNEDAETRVNQDLEEIQASTQTLKAEEQQILTEQGKLKKVLYAKFKDNINLEEE
mmetsp:Transcript_3802/g.6514  ORF Transcript_3802/g.6514 Transcript_3802/m.6514 type:complete len:120 (+) Transcript_3802:157-516(+)|eukprot:CAMPEP_0198210272 /NCGR_PEP_ID=MMETSP1445-20131203/20001_1 /TAXON_ID=36898 /ORGANISM="Pyramimonas sp., Strain CCMP2087" /LENGTH=119 /DNA_ID=CAMNT_0043884291 /DNA_START=157 /DNA_END=516 /DNA_ORIENTATION=+